MALSPDPISTAPELAEKFEMSQQGVYDRLKSLEDRGMVRSKKVGAAARVWWVTDQGRQLLRDGDSGTDAESV